MMTLGTNEQRTKLDISLSMPVNRNGTRSSVGTRSIRKSNLSNNNNNNNNDDNSSNDATIVIDTDEVDPVVLAKCQMKCLSLFLFVPTLIFTGIGCISLLHGFHITHSYSPVTGEIIDFYHCGCEGRSGSESESGHKTIILQHSASRYQYNQESSTNGISDSHDQTTIQNEDGNGDGDRDGFDLDTEKEAEIACTPLFGSIIEYSDNSGQRHSFPSNICTNSKPIIGKKNKVYFDPLDASKGKDGSFRSLWYFPLHSIMAGLIPAALLAILRGRREDLLKHQIIFIQKQQKQKKEQMRRKGEEESLLSKGKYGGDIVVAQACDDSATKEASIPTSNWSRSGVLSLDNSNDNFIDAENCLEMTSRK